MLVVCYNSLKGDTMSKFIIHATYSDGKSKSQLNDVCGKDCFVMIDGKLIHMALDSFLSRFKLVCL